jgi:hypothetical protein
MVLKPGATLAFLTVFILPLNGMTFVNYCGFPYINGKRP